ncbi:MULTISPECIES: hypothetical protein [unclassified Microbacterium]|uniref:hypothetical protein n=1 Tax=unclassified Microbacterium TaxID=2609290 RepID=UPI001ACECE72|nr:MULTISPECIES: hypothetical protein [unclassified Microbacterium]MBN9213511.1 hypothetical protein [Microbacterium sp.]
MAAVVMLPEDPDGWFPMPEGWAFRERRVITRRAHDESLAWFPVPDPSGYMGIGLALMNKTDVAREFWMWTDESGDRVARVVKLGHRQYVVELHGVDGCAVIEDPMRFGEERWVADDERDVLGHPAVSPAKVLSSSVMAESCARMWLDHGIVDDRYVLGRWATST